jgi:hypothetical protein
MSAATSGLWFIPHTAALPRLRLREAQLQGTVTNASYCSDDRRIIWRPSFIALRLLT